MMIIISSCLVGKKCRWDGSCKTIPELVNLVKDGKAVHVCPELLGGLDTPRASAEIRDGKVLDKDNNDLTLLYMKGGRKALFFALENGCRKAILKSKSPSCGLGCIYDGTFTGNLVDGDGIFCKLLKENHIEVITEKEFEKQ